MRFTKYTKDIEERAIFKMFQGSLTAVAKNKIIRSRKFPKNSMDNYDIFKTYFLSGEGLPAALSTLSEKEIVLLHLLHFNKWITDVSVFEALYVPLPEPKKYYWDYRTFTQKYGPVLKAVQANLVQKGVLVQYETSSGDTKAERQRFMFPEAFAVYLPSPLSNLKAFEEKGAFNDETIRKKLLEAFEEKSSNKFNSFALQQRKLHLGKDIFTFKILKPFKLHTWELSSSEKIMNSRFMEMGRSFSGFLLHFLQQLEDKQWFSPESLQTVLTVWSDPERRKKIRSGKSYQKNFGTNKWCETGWKCGILQKRTENGTVFYRMADKNVEEINFDHYFEVNDDGKLSVNLKSIPFSVLATLAQLAFFEPVSINSAHIEPDLVNISDVSSNVWEDPLIKYLEGKSSGFKKAFEHFRKSFGKQIIHENLLFAKITDLSLRVLVEKELNKNGQAVVLTDEFIAFPKSALARVEKIVVKSGNVIKRKMA